MDSKKEIRKSLTALRDALAIEKRRYLDQVIFEQFTQSSVYLQAQVLFAFVSFKSEVDTLQILKHAIRKGKCICLPKISAKQSGMEFFQMTDLGDLKQGSYGILEPDVHCKTAKNLKPDLILIPGLGFDRSGGRIGYGRGFYDQYLYNRHRSVPKISLAYSFQIIDKIPMYDTDVCVDAILTEKEWIAVTTKAHLGSSKIF